MTYQTFFDLPVDAWFHFVDRAHEPALKVSNRTYACITEDDHIQVRGLVGVGDNPIEPLYGDCHDCHRRKPMMRKYHQRHDRCYDCAGKAGNE